MSEAKTEKKGCKKSRRSTHNILRHRSKGKGNKGGRDQDTMLNRTDRLLARAIRAVPNGRILDREADQHRWWHAPTHLFLHPLTA